MMPSLETAAVLCLLAFAMLAMLPVLYVAGFALACVAVGVVGAAVGICLQVLECWRLRHQRRRRRRKR